MSIQVKKLTKKINQRVILNNISFTWAAGRIVGLVGRNGAGKTTLFRTITSHYLSDNGQILIDGKDVLSDPITRNKLFYLDTQNNFFNNQTLKQIAGLYSMAYPNFDTDRLLSLLQEEKLTFSKRYNEISKGQRMLFQILLSLVSGTSYIILDEPFDGLDLFVRERITKRLIDEVAERKVGLLISSHELDELDGLCEQILFLDHQHLIGDYDLENLRESARKVQLVFPSEKIPDIVRQRGVLIKKYGRVLDVVFENYDEETEKLLKAEHPVVMEFRPLTVTDIYRAKLGDHQAIITNSSR